jgi:hypothetical protein
LNIHHCQTKYFHPGKRILDSLKLGGLDNCDDELHECFYRKANPVTEFYSPDSANVLAVPIGWN